MSFVLACDLGGSSLRVALVDESGFIRSKVAVATADSRDINSQSEVDAAEWWSAFQSAADELARDAGSAFDAVEAVAITGVTRTQILVDPEGHLLRRAMTWKDSRATPLLDGLRSLIPADHPEAGRVNAFHPLARLYWLLRHERHVVDAAHSVLEPKDYFTLRLTGRSAIDPISSARLLAAALPGPSGISLFDAAGLPREVVPEALDPGRIVAPVRNGLPGMLARLAGRPVVSMGPDTWASALGLGALAGGRAYNLSGTTEVFGILTPEAVEAEGLLTVDWGDVHQLGGPSLSGADTIMWALELLGRHASDPGAVGAELNLVLGRKRQPEPLVFLPYLQGERTPYWNPALRGALLGINRRHGATDVLYAVLEGIALLNRTVLDRAEAAAGQRVGEIRYGGGGSANPTWCQIKADICDRPVVVTACPEPGLLGAAIVAWQAVGRIASVAEGQDRFVRLARRHEPDPLAQAGYRQLYDLFQAAEKAVLPISEELAKWNQPLCMHRPEGSQE